MQDFKKSFWFVCRVIIGSAGNSGWKHSSKVHPPAQTSLLRGLCSWILKTCRDGDCTASLGNLSPCLTILMGRKFLIISSVNLPFQLQSAFSHQYHCIKWVGTRENIGTCPKDLLISASRGLSWERAGSWLCLCAQCFLLLSAGSSHCSEHHGSAALPPGSPQGNSFFNRAMTS